MGGCHLRRKGIAALGLSIAAIFLYSCSSIHARPVAAQVEALLLSSAPHSPDSSPLNDLNGEEVALSSPLVVSGILSSTNYDATPALMSIRVDSVEYRTTNMPTIKSGQSIVVAGSLGIELPRGIGIIASLRKLPASASFVPTWITTFVVVAARDRFASINPNHEITTYSNSSSGNFFGCTRPRPSPPHCHDVRLRHFGIVGHERLAAFNSLVRRDPYTALLWMLIHRKDARRQFPRRLCRNVSETVDCASSVAFFNQLHLQPSQ